MKKKLMIIGFVMFVFFVVLSGCSENVTSNPEAKKFVGTWVYADTQDGTTIKFSSDGTFLYGIAGHSGTWTVQNGEIQLVSEGESATQTYSFSNGDTTLRIGPRDTFGFSPGNYTKQ